MIRQIVLITSFLLIFSMGVFVIYYAPTLLRSEYTTKISVDKPDKIENAMSNVVSDLKKRDFVPVYLNVTWYPASKIYVVYAKGIDRTKLGKYEP